MGIYTSAVQKLYVAYFNRPGDATGVAFWEAQLAANGGNVAAISTAFSGSSEYATLYAGQSNDQLVNNLYVNLFGRAAEPAGLTFWSLRISQGLDTIASIALSLANNAQGADATAVANKITAATSFTDALNTTAEIIGYSGFAANAIARTWLATVTDAASLVTATAAVDATVVSAAAAGSAVATTGTTFTLAEGLDNVTGTTNNDTVLGLVDGTDNTFTLGDTIDGGAGTDTLRITTDQAAISVAAATISNVEELFINSDGTGAVAATTANLNNVAFTKATFQGVAGVDAGADTFVISNIKKATTVVLKSVTDVGTTINFSDVTGTADSATLEVAGSTDTAGTDTENDLTVAGVETLTLNLTTAANDLDTITAAAAKTVNINVSGGNASIEAAADFSAATAVTIDAAKNLTLTAVANLGADAVVTVTGAGDVDLNTLDDNGAGDGVTVAASAMTGDLTVIGGANTVSITSGAGDDAITSANKATIVAAGAGADYVSIAALDYGDGVSTNGTVTGGDGTDTINITTAANLDAGTMAKVTGFEVLSIGSSAGGTYNLSSMGFTGVVVDADIAATTVSNITAETIDITATTTAALTLALKTATGSTDALTVTIEGAAVDTGADDDTTNDTNDLTANELVTASIETVTIESNTAATNEAGVSNVVSVLATDATKLVVTGDHVLTITDFQEDTSAAVNTDTVTIDASASAGLIMGDYVSGLNVSILGSEFADTLLVGDDDGTGAGTATGSTVNAGAGGDVLTISVAGVVDTLIINAGDSKIGYTDTDESGAFTTAADAELYDIVTGFVTTEDTIDLGSFSFTGTKASALAGPSLTEANAVKLVDGTTTSIASFFVATGVQRGVAVVSGDYSDLGGTGTDTLVFVDSNGDGNLSNADDMIVLAGVATVALADFGF